MSECDVECADVCALSNVGVAFSMREPKMFCLRKCVCILTLFAAFNHVAPDAEVILVFNVFGRLTWVLRRIWQRVMVAMCRA